MRESFSAVLVSKESLYEENQRLKALLAQHGISWTGSAVVDELSRNGGSNTSYTSSASIGSFSGPSTGATSPNNMNSMAYNPNAPHAQRPVQRFRDDIEYDTVGIDFVLTYDAPAPSVTQDTGPAGRYLTPPPQ